MPQLDKVSFLSQFFWLCVGLFAFYVFVLKTFLPQIVRVLKFRSKIVSSGNLAVSEQGESLAGNVQKSGDQLLLTILEKTRAFCQQSEARSQKCQDENITNFLKNWQNALQNFVQLRASNRLSNTLCLSSENQDSSILTGSTKLESGSSIVRALAPSAFSKMEFDLYFTKCFFSFYKPYLSETFRTKADLLVASSALQNASLVFANSDQQIVSSSLSQWSKQEVLPLLAQARERAGDTFAPKKKASIKSESSQGRGSSISSPSTRSSPQKTASPIDGVDSTIESTSTQKKRDSVKVDSSGAKKRVDTHLKTTKSRKKKP